MLRRGPVIVGDLQPIGVTRPLQVVRHNAPSSPWAVISITGLSALGLFGVGFAWLGIYNGLISPTGTKHRASETLSAKPFPVVFPPWIEVPRRTEPGDHEGNHSFQPADLQRSFLDPNPYRVSEQPVFQPPSTDLSQSVTGFVQLGTGRLPFGWLPAADEHIKGPPVATAGSPSLSEAVVLAPGVSQQAQDPAEAAIIMALPGDTAPSRTVPPLSNEEANTSSPIVDPAPVVTEPAPVKLDAEQSSDPAKQLMERRDLTTPPKDIQAVLSPILNPGPAKQARSLGRTRTLERSSSARVPYRDAQQTASIIRSPELVRRKIDAGAVARASVHRAWINRPRNSSIPAASTQSWTLPPALAPSD